jgi:hypothetical protein
MLAVGLFLKDHWRASLVVLGAVCVLSFIAWWRMHWIDQGVTQERVAIAHQAARVQTVIRTVVQHEVTEHTRVVHDLQGTLAHATEQVEAAHNDALSVLTAWRNGDLSLCSAAGGCANRT